VIDWKSTNEGMSELGADLLSNNQGRGVSNGEAEGAFGVREDEGTKDRPGCNQLGLGSFKY
jgi:hypothetical protein